MWLMKRKTDEGGRNWRLPRKDFQQEDCSAKPARLWLSVAPYFRVGPPSHHAVTHVDRENSSPGCWTTASVCGWLYG